MAGFVPVWTTVPAAIPTTERVPELDRVRWQVERAFERRKSSMGLGQLPKRSDASGRAWRHGKLPVALLVERLLGAAETFSPTKRPWEPWRSRWREVRFPYRELVMALTPRCGLAAVLAKWDVVAKRLADTKRKRRRQALS